MALSTRISSRDLENRVADITVTGIHRAEHGQLEAQILLHGETFYATRRSGSWALVYGGKNKEFKHPAYPDELQRHARAFEKQEAKQETRERL